LIDPYGRDVTGLRISLTPRCNLACFFCHKEWDPSVMEMTKDEILKIIEVAKSFGVNHLKITGGEPLLREDLLVIVSQASELLDEVSITTNGTKLSSLAHHLRMAGLSRVNVNLPTLSQERYSKICGANLLEETMGGIKAASHEGLPVKVNMVILKGVNEDEVERMIDFTRSFDGVLQLIELQPIPNDGGIFGKFHVSLDELEDSIRAKAVSSEPLRNGQRHRYHLRRDGGNATVDVVRPTHNPAFCMGCSRLRVTSDGKLKPCLLRSDNLVDLMGIMRSGSSNRDLAELFKEAIMRREPYWRELDAR